MTMNKGNSFLKNKTTEVLSMIEENKPDVMVLTESNIDKEYEDIKKLIKITT